ncbi:MAG TPA: glycosyl hydrolase [bacterium]|nr:glycosyl hydrolase [bacterium]
MNHITRIILIVSCCMSFALEAQTKADSLKNISLSGLQFRSIGPAFAGGRIVDIAVNPANPAEYFVASGHGSLWKTTNGGTTFAPVFDGQKSYSIGCVVMDPSNSNIVWVGTGESNGQSNVIFGDGIYRSEDGGKSWKNMGLENSEHIGGIVIDPRNSNTVYAAAYGPFRNDGGERGVYKTTDGGKTWTRVLHVSDYTGFWQIHMDPNNSSVLYAVAHQRFKKLYATVQGGPESAIYRSTDAGVSWQKVMSGLPSEDVGKIGLAIAPSNPQVLYAIVQAKEKGGVYRSSDRGASWVKRSSYVSTYAFYFQELFCDPKDENTVYSMDVFNQISRDGGATWSKLGEKYKHVDNHALWINPINTKHLIAGSDGGVYESLDQGKTWDFKANMPIAEVYKVSIDQALPFYHVYAGTQDNNSFFGPSRTNSSAGVTNQDWTFTLGGDGFETQADWSDENILYVQSQNGGLVRYDKKTGEQLFIKPIDTADVGYRFDWDAALLISHHDPKRLYFGGHRLFKTDDRGNTWTLLSGDLTRGVPQKLIKMQGKSWSYDELASKGSLANITAIAESPIDPNILFVGSGDGLIHYSDDGGKTWNKPASTGGLPEFARVHTIVASSHNRRVAYAACHNFGDGDNKPYLLKTSDGGKTWTLLNGNLPKRGSTYSFAEDHVDPNLLFVGTMFGLYVSNTGGQDWVAFNNGIPPGLITDMTIQKRENDLVVATFGRGMYILDDYTPLRHLSKETLQKDIAILPIKEASMFIPSNPFGFPGTGFQGAGFFATPNPETGAVFTYYVKDDYKSLKKKRRDTEKEKQKKGEDIELPSYQTLRNEADEQEPFFVFTIKDESGQPVRRIKTSVQKGVNRIVWDFRTNVFTPISLAPFDNSIPWNDPDRGYMVVPGKYTVSVSRYEAGQWTDLGVSQSFICKPLLTPSLPVADRNKLDAFNKKVAELIRAISSADAYRESMVEKIPLLKQAVIETAKLPEGTYAAVVAAEDKLKRIQRQMNGDGLRALYEGVPPTSLRGRVEIITGNLWTTTSDATTTFQHLYDVAAAQFDGLLRALQETDAEIKRIEQQMDRYGAPFTPGRLPSVIKN